MNHPELIAVPVLMIADHAMTILGAKKAAIVYNKHIKTMSYELNPVWRSAVDQHRWFNPRHLVMVAVITFVLILFDLSAEFPNSFFEFLLGTLFGVFGTVCGRHLTNLLLFLYVNRHPYEISGEVHMSMTLSLKLSQFTLIGLLPLLSIVVFLVPNSYTFGILTGAATSAMIHSVWLQRIRSTSPKTGHEMETESVVIDEQRDSP